jgi:hypothetical protein
VIFVDSNLFVIDLRYYDDSHFMDAFLSWNAKHFAGKLPVPALTPREWLRRAGGGRRR